MNWLGVAVLTGVIAGVGFWRGSVEGLASQSMPGLAGVVFSLVMLRATALSKDRRTLREQGGWPMLLGGALSLTASAAAAIDEVIWFQTKKGTFGALALPTATLAFVLVAITALRFSAGSPQRTQFYLLALIALGNAAVSAFLFVTLQLP